jgi:alpha-beta hydrolase superfamily lysophospholipase
MAADIRLESNGHAIAASVTMPPDPLRKPATVLVCWPGGSYGRSYWDLQIPNRPGYSFAEHMANLGFVVVTADPLGVGDSGRPADGATCTLGAMAAAGADVVRQVRQRLEAGRLIEQVPGTDVGAMVGVGHSLGAGLAVIEQALFDTYDAVCALGLRILAVDQATQESAGAALDDEEARRAAAIEEVAALYGSRWSGPATYGSFDKAPLQGFFNGPDVPSDVVAFDNANSIAWPVAAIVDALHVGLIAEHAQSVTCPVFLGFADGDFDGRPNAHDHVPMFASSSDVSLQVLPDTFHCSNFQPRRAELWERIAAWLRSLP